MRKNRSTLRFDLSEHGEMLIPRVLGRKIKSKVLHHLEDASDSGSRKVVVFEMEGVSTMSTGFAKELFGELAKELGSDFPQKISFEFGDRKEVLAQTIARGLKASNPSRRKMA